MTNFNVYRVGNSDYEYIAAQTAEEAVNEHLSRVDSDWYGVNEIIDVEIIGSSERGFFEKEDGTGYDEMTWEEWMKGFVYEQPTLLCWNE